MCQQPSVNDRPRATKPGIPYQYQRVALTEPDHQRIPAWRDVSAEQWADPLWQRAHSVHGARGLHAVMGALLSDAFLQDLADDVTRLATMSTLITPHMLNTIGSGVEHADRTSVTEAWYADPVRLYMLPVASDRHGAAASHPMANRDSLHERDMWVTEGLTHRYPGKVLAELTTTCPQYCGHCTRMDLVGQSTTQVVKTRFLQKATARYDGMLDYLRAHPEVRDVVVSGGDVANVPWPRLEAFLMALLQIESVRDIRLASKALVGLPQHWMQPELVEGLARVTAVAAARRVQLAFHTHANAAQQVVPSVADACHGLLAAGIRDVRNQGVLLRAVNDTQEAVLDLCFALVDHAGVMPYYFYMCDIVPNSEHWRTSLQVAIDIQHAIMGHLPGFATPRIVCDVPLLGKRWVDQYRSYDRSRGISVWGPGSGDAGPEYMFYDPLHAIDDAGRAWWAQADYGLL